MSNISKLLEKELKALLKRSQSISHFYSIENKSIKEITSDILQSDKTTQTIKNTIIDTQRRFFLFTYPSDGIQIKGYLSFVPEPTLNPLLILLRGGNRILGLMHPTTDFSCMKNYTVIATCYRGGVSEGQDEFGGRDVNDIDNLLHYFPTLQKTIGISLKPSATYMLGISRGALEMFLALGRFPHLQKQVTKAASLTGILDLRHFIRYRPDILDLFVRDFGLDPLNSPEEWIQKRNPMAIVPLIKPDLPFLLLQGTSDIRIALDEGYNMLHKLQLNGNPVTYKEIPGGDHGLANYSNRTELISEWFEN